MIDWLISSLAAAGGLLIVLSGFAKSKEASEEMLDAYAKMLERVREERAQMAEVIDE